MAASTVIIVITICIALWLRSRSLIKVVGICVAGCAALPFFLPVLAVPFKNARPPFAGTWQKGRETGLPIPRFVSLKVRQARMRVGPSIDYATLWIYQARGLPLEIISEYGHWRKVRDADGTAGWMYAALLSSARTGVVAPWLKANVMLRDEPQDGSTVTAQLQPNVRVRLLSCGGSWCHVSTQGDSATGYVKQQKIWGAYPGEYFG